MWKMDYIFENVPSLKRDFGPYKVTIVGDSFFLVMSVSRDGGDFSDKYVWSCKVINDESKHILDKLKEIPEKILLSNEELQEKFTRGFKSVAWPSSQIYATA